MKKISLSILLFFVLTFQTFAAVELDTDGNKAIDVNLGGTNAKTAGAALSNLGGQPYDADLDILSSGTFSQKRALIEAFAKPVLGVDALRTTMADFDGDCRYLVCHTAYGDGGHGTFRWDASSTAADDNGVTIAVTGVATGRWIRQLVSDYVTVEMFGGGVATANNATAWQNAFNAGYRNFKFGSGQYNFTSGVIFTDYVKVTGEGPVSYTFYDFGTMLHHTGTDDFITISPAVVRKGGVFKDLSIRSTNQTNNVLFLNKCSRVNCYNTYFFGGGYGVNVGPGSYGNVLVKCVIQWNCIAGVNVDADATDTTIDTCDFACNTTTTSWSLITRGAHTRIVNNWFEYAPEARPANSGGHILQPADTPQSYGCYISGNMLSRTGDNGTHLISILGGQYATITDNIFSGATSPLADMIYLDIPFLKYGYTASMISNNKFTNFVNYAINIQSGTVGIINNEFYTESTVLTKDHYINDEDNSESKIRIIGNHFGYSTSAAKYAVKGSATTVQPQITIFSDNETYNMGGSAGYIGLANNNRIDGGSSKLAIGLTVRDGSVIGNRVRNCITGVKPRACNVEGNYFDGNTTNIEPYTADGIYPLIMRNTGDVQTVTTSGATLNRYGVTYLDTTAGALTGALGNGYRPGDIKLFSVSAYTGTYSLTVSNHEGSSKVFTFSSINASLSLMWDGSTWVTIRDGSTL